MNAPDREGPLQVAEISQQKIFMLALFPGMLSIAASRYFGISGFGYLILGVAVPTLCMGGYLYVNYRWDFFDSTRAQVADNIYFLGFLFFLVSLAATLVLFATSKTPDQNVVVEGFGIALITTILGLLLRIIVLQRSAPFEDARERAEQDLLHAVLEFRTQVVASSESLRQAHQQAIASVSQTAAALAQQVTTTLEDVNRAALESIASVTDRMNRVDIPPDLFTRATAPALADLKNAITSLTQMTAEQMAASKDLAAKVRGLSTPVERTAKAVADLTQSLAAVTPASEQILRALQEASGSGRTLADGMQQTTQSARESAILLQGMSEHIRSAGLEARLTELGNGISTLRSELAALQAVVSAAPASISGSLANLGTVKATFDQVSTSLRQAVNDLNEYPRRAESAIAALSAEERARLTAALRAAVEPLEHLARELLAQSRETSRLLQERADQNRSAAALGVAPPSGTQGPIR